MLCNNPIMLGKAKCNRAGNGLIPCEPVDRSTHSDGAIWSENALHDYSGLARLFLIFVLVTISPMSIWRCIIAASHMGGSAT